MNAKIPALSAVALAVTMAMSAGSARSGQTLYHHNGAMQEAKENASGGRTD